MTALLLTGDCLEQMRSLPDASVDAVVTDPPYGIGFMGHEWDQPGDHGPLRGNGNPQPLASGGVPSGQRRTTQPATSGFDLEGNGAKEAGRYDLSRTANQRFQAWVEAWASECYRVLKPGGHLLSFGGTRTYHRLAAGVEDAGFEVRDCLAWMFGSGFPKSHDVAKAIDRTQGVDVTADERWTPTPHRITGAMRTGRGSEKVAQSVEGERVLYEPDGDDAKRWHGWGTALKPAFEPIVLARKPLDGTVAANVLEHGTGAINVDGCRIAFAGEDDEGKSKGKNRHADYGTDPGGNQVYGDYSMVESKNYDAPGRWPANVLLDEDAAAILDAQSGEVGGGHWPGARPANTFFVGQAGQDELAERSDGDSGGPSRFFYCAKTSRAERNAGLDGIRCDCETISAWENEGQEASLPAGTGTSHRRDTGASTPSHPTGKNDSEWSTSSSGSLSTDPSLTDSRSTTETPTSSTIESRISRSSTTSPTSESTPPTIGEQATERGSAAAETATPGSPLPERTSISQKGDGSPPASAVPASSGASSNVSSSGDATASVCPSCGGVIEGAYRNTHPT